MIANGTTFISDQMTSKYIRNDLNGYYKFEVISKLTLHKMDFACMTTL